MDEELERLAAAVAGSESGAAGAQAILRFELSAALARHRQRQQRWSAKS
jgi:hypothetical protein